MPKNALCRAWRRTLSSFGLRGGRSNKGFSGSESAEAGLRANNVRLCANCRCLLAPNTEFRTCGSVLLMLQRAFSSAAHVSSRAGPGSCEWLQKVTSFCLLTISHLRSWRIAITRRNLSLSPCWWGLVKKTPRVLTEETVFVDSFEFQPSLFDPHASHCLLTN